MLLGACAPAATPAPTAAPTEAPKQAEASSPAAPAAAGGPITIKKPMEAKDIVVAGVVFQDDQFMKSMVQGFQDAGKKLGVKQGIIGNSSNDQAKETELINTYISQGVNGIAIAP